MDVVAVFGLSLRAFAPAQAARARFGTRPPTRIRGSGRTEDTVTKVPMNSGGAMLEKVELQQGRFGTLWTLTLTPSLATSPTILRRGEDDRRFECAVPLDDDRSTVPADQTSILCLYRFKIWWMQPLWVSTLGQTPPETLLILYQTNHCTETEHGRQLYSQKSISLALGRAFAPSHCFQQQHQ
jgi:hypothetical protein